jgi:uroporphyrin-III C-methyltransferase
MTAPILGSVALVGAGPGDPDLLTRRAERLIRDADMLVYDALVNPEVLKWAPGARRVFVGKRAGYPSVRQSFINQLLIRHARRGLRVVRLKGGDPFVFGRGGEEAVALSAAGLRFEMVPGISSAVAAAGLAGIPVTHRGIVSGFVVVSGHDLAACRQILAGLTPGAVTVVVLMGLGRLARIADLLIECGWPPTLPVAIAFDSSGPQEETLMTTIAAAAASAAGVQPQVNGRAGTLVIGEVVRMRRQFPLANGRPLERHPGRDAVHRQAAAGRCSGQFRG